MLRGVVIVVGVLLAAGALEWTMAAVRSWRRSVDGQPGARRAGELAGRDGIVAALLALTVIATLARALFGQAASIDWLHVVLVVSVVVVLPFVRRHQGEVEVRHRVADEHERTRLELLYAVAAAGEHLSIADAANALADALVPELGDWSRVALVGGGGNMETLAVSRSRDDGDDRLVQELLERYPVALDPEVGIGLAIQAGTRVVPNDITDDLLARSATSAEHLAMLQALGLGTAVIEPLTVRGRRVGAIACLNRRDRALTAS